MSERKKQESPVAQDITSPPNRRSQRKAVSNSPVYIKAFAAMSEQKTQGSCTERRSQRETAETDMITPPKRRSQRKSAAENAAVEPPVCMMATMPEQKKLAGGVERRNQAEDHESSITSPSNRRSQRKSTTEETTSDSPMPAPIIKRSITAKKIMPRKTQAIRATAAPQSTPRPQITSAAPESIPVVLNVTPAPRRSLRVSPKIQKENHIPEKPPSLSKSIKKQTVTPIIDILSPIPSNVPSPPSLDDRDHVMSQKVRRSYSRLEMSLNGSSILYSPTKKNDSSDTSTPNHDPKGGRKSLFGFNKLLSTEAQEEEEDKIKRDKIERRKIEANRSTTGTALLEEPDQNIPGVAVIKEKRRKRKVQQIQKSDLDEWAAFMNAEFEEAEKFDLFVE